MSNTRSVTNLPNLYNSWWNERLKNTWRKLRPYCVQMQTQQVNGMGQKHVLCMVDTGLCQKLTQLYWNYIH